MSYNYPQQQQYNSSLIYKQPAYTAPGMWQAQQIPQIRPVSSIEEVRASSIDFDGSIFYFPDIANKKIYTKNVNMDGTVSINLYELKELTDQPTDSSSFVTRQEFENAIGQLKLMLQEKEEMAQAAAQQQKQSTFSF